MKKFIIAVLCVGLIGGLWNLVNCAWLFRWIYSIEPSSAYRPETLACRLEWYSIAALMKFLTAAVYVWAYLFVRSAIPLKGIARGLVFGLFLWAVGWVSTILRLFAIINMSGAFLTYVLFDFLGEYILIGMAIGLIYEYEIKARACGSIR